MRGPQKRGAHEAYAASAIWLIRHCSLALATSGQESEALHVFTTAAMSTIKYSSTVIPSVFYIQLGH